MDPFTVTGLEMRHHKAFKISERSPKTKIQFVEDVFAFHKPRRRRKKSHHDDLWPAERTIVGIVKGSSVTLPEKQAKRTFVGDPPEAETKKP
jgi:hypothetical protein